MSDQTAKCGPNDLNPNANLDLQYVHEFQNGNVLLLAGDVLYLFDGSQVRRLDTFRSLTSATTNTAAGGVTVPDNAFISRLPNLVMMFDGNPGNFVAVAENGTVIRDNNVGFTQAPCPTVTSGGNTFSISANGNVTSLNRVFNAANPVLASAGGKFLVYGSNNRLYLRDDPCLPDGQSVSPAAIAGVNDAQMVRVGNDFYIAVRVGANVSYYRVSGSNSTLLNTVALIAGGRFNYALDGAGRLYIFNAANQVRVYRPTDGDQIGTSTAVDGVNFVGMLGLADRVLVRDNAAGGGDLHEFMPTGGIPRTTVTEATLRQHFNNCTNAQTKAVDGIGTNFIRCMFDDGTDTNGQRLSSIAFVGGQYRRPAALVTIDGTAGHTATTQFDILFGANALIVRHATDNSIRLCTTTSTASPSISCSDTGVLNAVGRPLGFAELDTNNDLDRFYRSYLKSRGSEVFYRSGTTPFVGDVFNPTPLSIPLSNQAVPTGGNASFDLNKFAFGSIPPGGNCRNRIVYLSSRTASPKTYTIAQPSGACVKGILKVFSTP